MFHPRYVAYTQYDVQQPEEGNMDALYGFISLPTPLQLTIPSTWTGTHYPPLGRLVVIAEISRAEELTDLGLWTDYAITQTGENEPLAVVNVGYHYGNKYATIHMSALTHSANIGDIVSIMIENFDNFEKISVKYKMYTTSKEYWPSANYSSSGSKGNSQRRLIVIWYFFSKLYLISFIGTIIKPFLGLQVIFL